MADSEYTSAANDGSIACESPHAVFASLADADSRAILQATATGFRSVPELVEECDIPTATAYRKVDRLVDAGLLEERIEIRATGKNIGKYGLRVREVTVTIADRLECTWLLDVDGSVPARSPVSEGVDVRERGVKTDGGIDSNRDEGDRQRLGKLFVDVTGTDVLVDEQDSTARLPAVTDDTTGSISAYVAATARADGLEEAIDEPDVAPDVDGTG